MEKDSHTMTLDDGIPKEGEKYVPTGMDSFATALLIVVAAATLILAFREWTYVGPLTKIVFIPFIGIILNAFILLIPGRE